MKNHVFMNLIINFFCEVADLIYPPKCLLCGDFRGSAVCDECYDMIKAGSDLKIEVDFINKVFILGKYDGYLEKAVRLLKFHNKVIITLYLGKLLADKIIDLNIYIKDAIFVPVPLHIKRIKERGFNQSKKILEEAKIILPEINIIQENRFIRTKNTKHFFDLKENERSKEIKNAFEVADKNYFKGKNIILFDDILTTGLTLKEAARTLRAAGAGEISAIALSKA